MWPAATTTTLMSGIRATGATVVPFSVGTGLPLGTTLAVDIRTDAGPWAHLTGVAVTAQGQFSIADSNFAAGESSFVRVKREDQPESAYSAPIAVVVDPSVTASSSSTINQISLSRVRTDLKLRWSLAANNNKPFKILFRRADNNTELDLTPMGLPANSRELSLGSQSQNLPAGNFLAHQVLGTVDQGGLGGHFEDGTIPPPASTGPVYIVQYHHRDHLGTLRLITDEMGGLIEAHDYEPFGVELNPPYGAASRKKYTGHERDESTGLDYMLARYYPSTIGRFLSVDPGFAIQEKNPQSWNTLYYVRNNPAHLKDPSGEAEFAVFDSFSSSDLQNGTRPDWGAIKAIAEAHGHVVTIYSGSAVNPANFNAALSKTGMNVISVGHSVEIGGKVEGILLGDRSGIGNPGYTTPGGNAMTSPSAASADSVALFACNSIQVSEQYSGAQSFIGVDSGMDGATNSLTLEKAAAAFLANATSQPAMQSVDLGAATAAANRIVATSTQTYKVDKNSTPYNMDKGDGVQRTKP